MVGSTVLGQYELTDILGQGGMSVVYLGKHKLTEQEVALKILPPELAAHAQVKSRFVEEARALAQLDHPNIVHLYNFGQENGCFVLAMQFVRGQTWERMILENERLDWALTARIAIDVLRALEYAHGRGIVHRDMKPSNVLVRDDDRAATVMDFGIAKMTTSTKLTATGQTMGTVRYMSPEQVRGQEVDAKTDLYSLGATIYESIVGDTPFLGENYFEIMTKHLNEAPISPLSLGHKIPEGFDALILKSLAKKPEDRFESARDFRKAIETVLIEAGIPSMEQMRLQRESVHSIRQRSSSSAIGARGSSNSIEPPLDSAQTIVAKASTPRISLDGVGTGGSTEQAKQPSRSNAVLIGALGGLVLAGTIGVGVAIKLRRTSGARVAAAVAHAREAPAAFAPPGVTWQQSLQRPDEHLTIDVATAAPLVADVFASYTRSRDEFLAFAKQKLPSASVTLSSLHVLVVDNATLCSASTFRETKRNGEVVSQPVPTNCEKIGFFYRPLDHSLVVTNEAAALVSALKRGLVEAIAVQHKELSEIANDFKD